MALGVSREGEHDIVSACEGESDVPGRCQETPWPPPRNRARFESRQDPGGQFLEEVRGYRSGAHSLTTRSLLLFIADTCRRVSGYTRPQPPSPPYPTGRPALHRTVNPSRNLSSSLELCQSDLAQLKTQVAVLRVSVGG